MSINIKTLPFEHRDSSALYQKIERFNSAGCAAVHLVLDFDRTLTIAADPFTEATSWQVMERQMPLDGKNEYAALFEKYRRFELDGTLTAPLAEEWWDRSLSLLTKYSVNLNVVESDFLQSVGLREGAAELFNIANNRGVPSIVLSAGVKDVIDILLAQSGVSPFLVISTELTTNENGVVTGWLPSTVVHVLNKSEVRHFELDRTRRERPLSIIVGDSLDDANMAAGEEDVLRIRIVDPRPDEDVGLTLSKTFDKFDLAVLTGDLNGVSQLIQDLPA